MDEFSSWAVPWLQTPLASLELDRSELDDETKRIVRSYLEDGYVVLEDAVSDAQADEIVGEVKGLFPDGVEDREHTSVRVQDVWDACPAVRSLACDPRIIALLQTLYRREPIAFQTLNFRYGTEQRAHQDRMFFNTLPSDYMCGVWVALEDVSEDNGAIFYYPGSHKLPFYSYDDLGLGYANPASGSAPNEEVSRDKYETLLQELVESRGLERHVLNAKKGTVLIWAAGMVHGGERIGTPGRTRWSQVTHYFFHDCLYYTPIYSNEYTGDLYLRKVRDARTGDSVPNSYYGMPFEIPQNGIYKLVVDQKDGADTVRAISPLAHSSRSDEWIHTLETHVRDYKEIISNLETSASFRIGRAVTSPLRMLRDWLR